MYPPSFRAWITKDGLEADTFFEGDVFRINWEYTGTTDYEGNTSQTGPDFSILLERVNKCPTGQNGCTNRDGIAINIFNFNTIYSLLRC